MSDIVIPFCPGAKAMYLRNSSISWISVTKKLQFFLLKQTISKPYDMVAILVRVRARRAYTNSIPITKTISKSNL